MRNSVNQWIITKKVQKKLSVDNRSKLINNVQNYNKKQSIKLKGKKEKLKRPNLIRIGKNLKKSKQ